MIGARKNQVTCIQPKGQRAGVAFALAFEFDREKRRIIDINF